MRDVHASERLPAHTRVTVIGVARDVTQGQITDGRDRTCAYFATSFTSPGELSILVRGRGQISDLRRQIAAAVRVAQPDATFRMYSLVEMVGVQEWAFGAISGTATAAAIAGLLLAFSGTFAVVSFLVTQRTREFGIRMALGATVQRLVASVVGSLLGVTAIAGGAGVVAAAGLAHLAQGTLEMTPAFGPIPYIGGMLVVVSASVVAALLPSLRTARINPVAALRAE